MIKIFQIYREEEEYFENNYIIKVIQGFGLIFIKILLILYKNK